MEIYQVIYAKHSVYHCILKFNLLELELHGNSYQPPYSDTSPFTNETVRNLEQKWRKGKRYCISCLIETKENRTKERELSFNDIHKVLTSQRISPFTKEQILNLQRTTDRNEFPSLQSSYLLVTNSL